MNGACMECSSVYFSAGVGVQSVPRVECPPGQMALVLIVLHGLSTLVLFVLASAKCPPVPP